MIICLSLERMTIDNEDFSYLIFNNVDGHIEEKNGLKYLVFAPTDQKKEALKMNTNLWNKIKNQIETINDGEPNKYSKAFVKIRFESRIRFPTPLFEKDGKYYQQVYLHECLYEI